MTTVLVAVFGFALLFAGFGLMHRRRPPRVTCEGCTCAGGACVRGDPHPIEENRDHD